jgi:membrane-associated phospholipid phosphatase
MKPAVITLTALIGGAILGFLVIAFGYIAYADSTNYFDREGATGMGVVFFYAPLGGLITGIIAAVVTFKILHPRPR